MTSKCSLCPLMFGGYGNNPYPLCEKNDEVSRCCDYCNLAKVIPARLASTSRSKTERLATKGLEATECGMCGDYCEKVKGSDDDICGGCEGLEEVYLVVKGVDKYVEGHADLQQFRTYSTEEGDYKTTYFQTYGGGPEGGYFIKTFCSAQMWDSVNEVYSVKREWGTPFVATKLNGTADYNPSGNGTAGTIRFTKK